MNIDEYNKVFLDCSAAVLYAIIEASDSEEDKRPADIKYYINWFLNYIAEFDGTEHFGDCTNHAIACHQCIIDAARDNAELIINKEGFNKYLVDEELLEEINV